MTDRFPARRRVLKLLAGGAVGAPILARAEALEAALTSSIAEFSFQADSWPAIRRLRDERAQGGTVAESTRSAVRLGVAQAQAAPHVAQDGGGEAGRHRPRLRGLLDA